MMPRHEDKPLRQRVRGTPFFDSPLLDLLYLAADVTNCRTDTIPKLGAGTHDMRPVKSQPF
jgi:hypothetical protein